MAASGEARTARAGDPVRLKSGGAVMTADRVNHLVEQSFARCVWLDAQTSASTVCPEARMAGGNNSYHHHNHHLR